MESSRLNMVVSLPYYANSRGLPSRLPTKEEIESSKDILSDDKYGFGRKVVAVGPHFVVKYGVGADPMEGEKMLFVQQNTSVPIPRVYAVYTDISDSKTYIIMERVTGDSLVKLWPNMSEADKSVVSAKLRGSMDQLRRLPSPGSYCSLGNRGLLFPLFRTENLQSKLSIEGLFDTEDQLNAAMVDQVRNRAITREPSIYERALAQIFRDHPPTFTHGAFYLENILVRKLEPLDGSRVEDVEVLLIDWKFSGWYPSYWEYAIAFEACFRCENDWNRWINKILDMYIPEGLWMHLVLRLYCSS